MSAQAWPMLNPRSLSDFGNRTAAATGPHLTPEDIKLALGGLAPAPYLFGMAAFLRDEQSRRRLEGHMLLELRWMADAGDWITKAVHVEILDRMAQLVVWESTVAQSRNETLPGELPLPQGSAAVLCPACNGRAERGTGRFGCKVCDGSRRFILTDPRRAAAIGLHGSNWRRTWRERYAEAMEHPRRWEAVALAHVRRKISGGSS